MRGDMSMVSLWYQRIENIYFIARGRLRSSLFTPLDLSILFGNALERFDTSLYSFLAPIMASLFFPHYDPIVQLIAMYGIAATSFIARPVGTFLFCIIAKKYGSLYALSCSLYFVSIAAVCVGCLPSYETVGFCAPALLILMRLCKGICAAGESVIAKLYIMEGKSDQHALRASYWYQSSSVMGIVGASVIATYVIGVNPGLWRFCFLFGGLAGLVGYYVRFSHSAAHNRVITSLENTFVIRNEMRSVWKHKKNIARVAIATCFSHATYAIPFIFMNTLVPRVSTITLEIMMVLNTMFLFLDMIMIPLLGYMLEGYEYKKVMGYASGILSVTIVPLFFFLPNASLAYVTCVRLWVVLLGLVFLCPLNMWCKKLFDTSDQYVMVGIGNMIATSTVAHLVTPICLSLWYLTGTVCSSALYIAFLMCVTSCAVLTADVQK